MTNLDPSNVYDTPEDLDQLDLNVAISTLHWIAEAAMAALEGRADGTHVLSQINNTARGTLDRIAASEQHAV